MCVLHTFIKFSKCKRFEVNCENIYVYKKYNLKTVSHSHTHKHIQRNYWFIINYRQKHDNPIIIKSYTQIMIIQYHEHIS